MKLKEAQQHLAVIWLVGGCVVFLWMSFQTVGRIYTVPTAEAAKQAFSWLGTQLAPILTLMMGVLVRARQGRAKSKAMADSFMFVLTSGISVFYFLVLLAVVISARWQNDPIAHLSDWAVPLGLVQGILGVPLGLFFAGQDQNH